ncbi:hypothetical protein Nepgr_022892 [Nepenthes gracilis]|uniref:Uncharacterized protein n=1 Tax=Nepenthes gracilis TaxID=150966 RepID=A0AAD3T0B0_NEPGR|nr:hypothetical protein Nepgr_022892 [Nepenthes gracilis]
MQTAWIGEHEAARKSTTSAAIQHSIRILHHSSRHHKKSRRHQRHHFSNGIKESSVGLFSSTLRPSSTAAVEKNSIEPPQLWQVSVGILGSIFSTSK